MDTVVIKKKEIDAQIAAALPQRHFWQNRFHLEMPFGLINDPNGLCYCQGWYHIFMQWNPLGCEHKHKCWAHVQTRDFVHYSRPRLALWPQDAYDKDGCYSGSAYARDGQVQVVYTGNVKYPDGGRGSFQRAGTLTAAGTIQREKVLLSRQPLGYTAHFRDPFYFTREGREFLLLAAQTEALQGRALLYEHQQEEWVLLGPVQTPLTSFGYMWECPNLLQFAEGEVLLFCPQGLPAEPYKYQNRYQSGYLCGHLDLDHITFQTEGDFIELDKGFDFYAPQVLQQGSRVILLGWAGMPEQEGDYPTAREGWMHALTLPRELTLREGRLYQRPLAELQSLRGEPVVLDTAALLGGAVLLPRLVEVQLELQLAPACTDVTVTLGWGEDKLLFVYDRRRQVMTVDRRQMRLGGRGVRQFRLAVLDRLQLELFVDASLVECFLQAGAKVATSAIFPSVESNLSLSVQAAGCLEAGQGEKAEAMMAAGVSRVTEKPERPQVRREQPGAVLCRVTGKAWPLQAYTYAG